MCRQDQKECDMEEVFSQPSGSLLLSCLSAARRSCRALQYTGTHSLAVPTILCPLRRFGLQVKRVDEEGDSLASWLLMCWIAAAQTAEQPSGRSLHSPRCGMPNLGPDLAYSLISSAGPDTAWMPSALLGCAHGQKALTRDRAHAVPCV